MKIIRTAVTIATTFVMGASPALAAGPDHVDITWMSIANMHYQIGALGVLTDGYITRIPESQFHGGGGGYAYTSKAWKPDVEAVSRVLDAIGGPDKVSLLLTGHSHWDHSFDTATWSKLTGAPVIGSRTTCFETMAENLPAERCRAIYGQEKIELAAGVTMRVVRWNHSGDPAKNWEQHDPVELADIPRQDPASGGLKAGVAEDFPNGGGNRGFLFTVDGPQGKYSWYFHDSASAVDLDVPIVIDGVDYGAPIENLKNAMRVASHQLQHVARIETDIAVIKKSSEMFATKADVSEAKAAIIMWVVGSIFLAQLLQVLPAVLRALKVIP